MDVLVVIGTSSAWRYGVILIFIGCHDDHLEHSKDHEQLLRQAIHAHAHNFETSATLITVILLGKYMESYSKKSTADKLSQLASLKATKAVLV